MTRTEAIKVAKMLHQSKPDFAMCSSKEFRDWSDAVVAMVFDLSNRGYGEFVREFWRVCDEGVQE
jgi:hypothetical protein